MTQLSKTYLFKDKDPVIDIVRQCVEIFATINNISFNRALQELSKTSGVSVSCMRAWFFGATCKPFFCSVVRVVRATGRDITVAGLRLQRSRSHLRVAA